MNGPQPQYVEGPPPAPAYYPEAAPPAPAPNPLDQLMAPVALYPDPLISIILPASTFPSDVASAGAYLNGGGDPGQVDGQPWDPSVRSLAHYPDVAKWMAQNQAWTQSVGAAFASTPADVMSAIQRLRELARADGTLTNTPQQVVVASGTFVEIEPAQPNVIYVPIYDPAIVFVDQPYVGFGGPFFAYGPPYQAGAWLTFGCNWHGGGVLIVDQGYWRGGGGGWRSHDEVSISVSVGVRPWSYPAGRPMPQAPGGWRNSAAVVSVRPIAGAPARPPQAAFRNIHTTGPAAVAVVSRNPAAFKGRPINTAILPKAAAARAPAARPRANAAAQAPARTGQKGPAGEEKPLAKAPAPAPRPAVERTPAAEPRAESERPAAEGQQPGATRADPKKPAPKKVVKPSKPKPEEEKKKEDEPQH